MNTQCTCLSCCLASLIGAVPAHAEAPAESPADEPASVAEPADPEDTWGFGAHPIIGYEPEASWTFGAGAEIYVEAADPERRPDDYTLNVTYSLRNQATLSLEAVKYLGGDDLELDGKVAFTNTPSTFYGVGPDTPEADEEEYAQLGVHPTLALLSKVAPGLSVGPELDFFYSDITDVEPGGLLASGRVPGAGRNHESGLGLVASNDTTNRKLYKRAGLRTELRTSVYAPFLGSSHTFGTSGLNVRYYLSLPWTLVLAFQVGLRSSYGEVPFFYLQSLGSKKLLRGYSGERYVAHHFVGGQTELRYPIFWRFGGTVFVGAAEIEDDLTEFGRVPRAAGGLGWRFALNRSQTINLRFDLTYNTDGEAEKYIKLGEAF